MRRTFLAMILVMVATVALGADDKTDVMAVVNQFVEGLNKADATMATGACAAETAIIDEIPPYEWHGSGACQSWWNDFGADAEKNVITEPRVTMGNPRHVLVAGDRAYAVVPSTYSYKKQGKPVKETKAAFTVALKKGAEGWRIAAWSWAKP